MRHEWVAAVPTTWNIVPNGRDGIMGTTFDPSQTVFPTVVYRRYTKNWRRPLRNAPVRERRSRHGPRAAAARASRRPAAHPLQEHGPARTRTRCTSTASTTSRLRRRRTSRASPATAATSSPARRFTYRLNAGADSAGVWPYHDHSPSMHESLAGGLWGALSIRGRHERRPDREFVTVFAPMRTSRRSTAGPSWATRRSTARRWATASSGTCSRSATSTTPSTCTAIAGARPRGVPEDTRTLGPAESFRVSWREDAPGTWLYHCHVEQHMAKGMIGIYKVSPR